MSCPDALDYGEKSLNEANSLLNAKTEQRSLKNFFACLCLCHVVNLKVIAVKLVRGNALRINCVD